MAAFPQPTSAAATYDTINHTAIFTWKIDPVNTNNFIRNNFIIEVSSDPLFKNFTKDSVIYNNTDASFSYTTQNLSPKMYFRVSRDYNSADWHLWDIAKEDSIVIPFVSLNADSTKATLQDDNSAKITWNPNPAAWLPGSSFIITKLNYTLNTQTEFKLGEDEFNAGSYIDNQISTCTQYDYSLQVIPPTGSLFNAEPAVPVRDSIIRADIGKLLTMTASKGYFPDRTELNWTSGGSFDNFIIKRSVYGANNYVQILTVPAAYGATFQADDEKGTPGTYYSYQIIGYLNCNNKPVYAKDTLHVIGFRSPTGNIHGRIIYVNGQAVQNASVRTESKDAVQTAQSIYLDGDDSSYMKLDSLNKPFTDSAITIETWIKPSDALPKNEVIFSRDGQYELGFDENDSLYFSYNNIRVIGNYKNVNGSFVHVAGVHNKDSLSILLNDSLIKRIAISYQSAAKVDTVVYIGKSKASNNYKGYIDEMRVWNIALQDSIIARDYTRILTGGENGLAAYWRFDETIPDAFYDLSYKNTDYNMNDGSIHGNAIHSATIPTPDQLSFKSYTDSTGSYLIAGIPYTGNGTTYSIVPLLGTHVFDPVSDSRLISASSTDFTVNFTDNLLSLFQVQFIIAILLFRFLA